MRILKYISIFALVGFAFFYYYQMQPQYITINGETMGTYYTIKINSSNNNKMLGGKIKAELAQINRQMSVFDASSELNKINKAEAGVWVPVSEELSLVLQTAHNIYQLSGGAFDPTVGKLIELWGFGTSKQKAAPTSEEVKEALKFSGFDKIEFSKDFRSVRKKDSRTQINLSALAKGYGVDKIAELIKAQGYDNFIVEIGGEVKAIGRKSEEVDGWNVAISDPQTGEHAYVVTIKDTAVATSGDYRNYQVIDGKRYSHTISPKTGHPIEHNITSVTVFEASTMKADALATAIMSMGEKKGIEFANNNNLSVVIFTRDENDKIKTFASQKAKKLLGSQYEPNQP